MDMAKKDIYEPDESVGQSPSMNQPASKGLSFQRVFSKERVHPFDEVSWEKRKSVIADEKGNTIFEMDDVEVPTFWSQLATNILASKYFRRAGVPNETGCERSLKQVLHRICHTLRVEGENMGGYFATPEDAEIFEHELTSILLSQTGAFNSPVWFNLGLYHEYGIAGSGGNFHWDHETQTVVKTENSYQFPQCSACFIQSIEDDLMSIFDLVKQEARVFKFGSGTGTNFSKIRGKQEKLSGGGTSSGLMSFLEVFDRGAGATKSGGTTRRAAKMVCLDIDHPEIIDFIHWKAKEEKKAHVLIHGGYDPDFNGEAYKTISGQNSNNSVRTPDEFLQAVERHGEWNTRFRTNGEICETFQARDIMRQIAEAAWECADPGIQYHTTINAWNTCSGTDRISASNPCSEFMFLDDTACNLASLNLLKFLHEDGTFQIEKFRHAIDILICAQEIIIDLSSYPTAAIARRSHEFRPLGLGYANLGALLIVMGVPYDSEEGRAIAAALTAIMTGHGYRQSGRIAASKGSFSEFYPKNSEPMMAVMEKHRAKVFDIPAQCPEYLKKAALTDWNDGLSEGKKFGYRNAQITVLAPTGTIAFVMECDTTGIEPDYALVKLKKLAGGGSLKIVNQSVPWSLKRLGYSDEQIRDISVYMLGTQTLNGAPEINYKTLTEKGLNEEDLRKLDKAVKSAFDLQHVFHVGILGEETLARLGFSKDRISDPSFHLLRALGFTASQIDRANEIICGAMTIEGAPRMQEQHLKVFDCANKCGKIGRRFIDSMGHVRMMAAVQPFISGAISKTVNVPEEATADQIMQIYLSGWKLGLKAISIYRDGCKRSQPLNTKSDEAKSMSALERIAARRKMPDERQSITHKFNIGNHKGYITVGLYEDGVPGEIFIKMAKEGTVLSGLMDSFALSISLALQYGVPLKVLVSKFAHMHFEPYGMTSNPSIRIAKSTVDYIFRWLALKFLPDEERALVGVSDDGLTKIAQTGNGGANGKFQPVPSAPARQFNTTDEVIDRSEPLTTSAYSLFGDAQSCDSCGSIMLRNGTCYKCPNCGSTSGCS